MDSTNIEQRSSGFVDLMRLVFFINLHAGAVILQMAFRERSLMNVQIRLNNFIN